MSDKPSEYRHHDGTPGSAADRSAKTAIPDSFPASDPMATTPMVGLRAEPVAELMEAAEQPALLDPAMVTARLPDHVTAKLAVEKLVRDIPLDRRSISISEEGGRSMLEVNASKPDMERIIQLLRASGGEISALPAP